MAGGKHGEHAYALLTPVSRLVSIVIPVLNEREALPGLLEEITANQPKIGLADRHERFTRAEMRRHNLVDASVRHTPAQDRQVQHQ